MSYNPRLQGGPGGGPQRGGQGGPGGGNSRAGGQAGYGGGNNRGHPRGANRPPQSGSQPPRGEYHGGGGGRGLLDRSRGGRGGRARPEPVTRLHAELHDNKDMRSYEDECIKVQSSCEKSRILEWKKDLDDWEKKYAHKAKLTKEEEKEKPVGPPPPRRPAFATIGKSFLLRADFFEIAFRDRNKCFFAYSAKLNPDPTSKWRTKAVFLALLEDPRIKKFFGSSDMAQELVTVGRLTTGDTKVITMQIKLPGKTILPGKTGQAEKDPSETYSITLTETAKVCLEDILTKIKDTCQRWPLKDEATYTRVLNVLLTRHQSLDQSIVTTGKGRQKYFYIDPRRKEYTDLGAGLEVIRGYFSSVRFGAQKLLLNLNVTHGTFFVSQPFPAYTALYEREHEADSWSTFEKQIKGIRIEVSHLPKELDKNGSQVFQQRSIWGVAHEKDGDPSTGRKPPRVKKLGAGPNDVSFFEDNQGNGTWTTVSEYFRRTYNVTARSNLPVLNLGSRQRPVYVPQECCRILPGQVFRGELVTSQRQNMITFSCRRPPNNYKSITETGLGIMGIANDNVRETNLDINKEMITVPARLLAPPNLKYGESKASVRAASWNLSRTKFTAVTRDNIVWAIIVFKREFKPKVSGTKDSNTPKVDKSLVKPTSDFVKCLRGLGFQLNTPVGDPELVEYNHQNYRQKVNETLSKETYRRSTFVLILMADNEERLFNHIKLVGDCQVGCLTHCCKYDKWKDGNEQYMANNAMKINLKLGGTCQSLDPVSSTKILAGNKTMVVGLDVTHPTGMEYTSFPSVAAIVASVNARLGQWPGEARMQDAKQEIIQEVGGMLEWRLKAWHNKNSGQLPENILIYRDGVSDGQYVDVRNKELDAMKKTCHNIYVVSKKLPMPKFTYIVVTKRHHVRFFGAKGEDLDQNGNLHPGTVVDRGITRASLWHFYLQAQQAIMGSARPAHYVVMHDEIFTNNKANPEGKPADKVQELTHNICYMMGRCTRAVSYGTPAFLADKLCERARRYVKAWYTMKDAELGGPPRDKEELKTFRPTRAEMQLHNRFHETMAYI
ncbi:hypothetical protein N7478_006493 [Penicillium angulare]|uniref:uncharacterized protein n=1 Tax=Penicillium angulare TaxID=116970 RepID=UPI00254254AB|nr:uncharacterized protein N7478_006493 [Penicillium angulare]KAJ5281121.1 hypothetical protein N7478_006493 [Penicillium angulare]